MDEIVIFLLYGTKEFLVVFACWAEERSYIHVRAHAYTYVLHRPVYIAPQHFNSIAYRSEAIRIIDYLPTYKLFFYHYRGRVPVHLALPQPMYTVVPAEGRIWYYFARPLTASLVPTPSSNQIISINHWWPSWHFWTKRWASLQISTIIFPGSSRNLWDDSLAAKFLFDSLHRVYSGLHLNWGFAVNYQVSAIIYLLI